MPLPFELVTPERLVRSEKVHRAVARSSDEPMVEGNKLAVGRLVDILGVRG